LRVVSSILLTISMVSFRVPFLRSIPLLGIHVDFSVKLFSGFSYDSPDGGTCEKALWIFMFLIKRFLLLIILESGNNLGVGIKVRPLFKRFKSLSESFIDDKLRVRFLLSEGREMF